MNNLKKTGGFTLVELIVVIAILGILAAVAVPAYSGYVKKANEAGDTQIVSAVNTAIQAACAENNTVYTDLTISDIAKDATTITITKIGSVECKQGTADEKAADAKASEIEADFTTYFGGNTVKLNYYTKLTQDTTSKLMKGEAPTT